MADDHLVPESHRGLMYMPPLPDDYGVEDAIRIYTSSSVNPSIWLNVNQHWPLYQGSHVATVHMSVETARKLRDQIDFLLVDGGTDG